jgi:hypothetical protein
MTGRTGDFGVAEDQLLEAGAAFLTTIFEDRHGWMLAGWPGSVKRQDK